jgi:hypothetical protein
MKLEVTIPEPLATRLVERAEQLDLDLDVVLVAALSHSLRQAYMGETTIVHEHVVQLVKEGHCDADIAAMLHYTPGWVAQVRRAPAREPPLPSHRLNERCNEP